VWNYLDVTGDMSGDRLEHGQRKVTNLRHEGPLQERDRQMSKESHSEALRTIGQMPCSTNFNLYKMSLLSWVGHTESVQSV
jgi:hypothetical protein